MVHIYRDLRKIKNSSPSIHPHTTQFRVTRKYLLEMMLNPKRLFEQMCFKCSLEGWHTTTTPDLFWQIVPQTRSQNTKSSHHMSHFPWLAQQADYHMKTSDRAHCWSMGPAFLPGRWAPDHSVP